MLGAGEIIDRIGAGPAHVAHRFIAGGWNIHRGEISVAQQFRELLCIAPVGPDLFAGLALGLGGSDHDTFQTEVDETPGQHEAGRAGFVADFQVLEVHPELLGEAPQGDFGIGHRSATFAVVGGLLPAAFQSVRDGVFFRVDVQSDVV